MVYTEFFIHSILLAALWALGLTEPLNRNEYLEYFVDGKGGRCRGLTTLPPSCLHVLVVKKYGTLNLLAPQEPVQVWQGLVTVGI